MSKVAIYRPVSLLSIMSKLMKSVVESRLTKFVVERGILSVNQFGFRKNLGTTDQLSHAGLQHKLRIQGVKGNSLKWIASYLEDRQSAAVVAGSVPLCFPFELEFPRADLLAPSFLVVC